MTLKMLLEWLGACDEAKAWFEEKEDLEDPKRLYEDVSRMDWFLWMACHLYHFPKEPLLQAAIFCARERLQILKEGLFKGEDELLDVLHLYVEKASTPEGRTTPEFFNARDRLERLQDNYRKVTEAHFTNISDYRNMMDADAAWVIAKIGQCGEATAEDQELWDKVKDKVKELLPFSLFQKAVQKEIEDWRKMS
jgi:hypothetical protein